MKNRNVLYLSLLLACICIGCSPSFRKIVKAYEHGNLPEARSRFERFSQHPKYGPAARYFLGKINLKHTRELPDLLLLGRELKTADSLFRQLPARTARRQTRHFGIDTTAYTTLLEQTQRWAIAWTRVRGSLPALDSLLDGLPDPLPTIRPDIENTRRDIVNAHLGTADYDTMTAILNRHLDYVLLENYDQTRRMQNDLWPAFEQKYGSCAIDRFAREHPHTFIGRDCWLTDVRPLLCTGTLEQLLDFRNQNRWTALEIILLNRIAALETAGVDSTELSAAHWEQLNDLRRRNALRRLLLNSSGTQDTAFLLDQTLLYISSYAPRYSAFRLMDECLEYFIENRYDSSAIVLLERARPYFPDTLPAGCRSNFDFQWRVTRWIDGKLPILRRPALPFSGRKLAALNTPEGDEFSPVVSVDGRELFFAASGRPENVARTDIFYSRWDTASGDWGPPRLVAELSGPGRQTPLSITADGCQLLLFRNGRLFLSRRSGPGADWNAPKAFPVDGIAVMGRGQLSADGNTLVLEGAYSTGTARFAPDLDIFVSTRDPATGAWSRPAALGAAINTDGEEANPFLNTDGSRLYYTSTGYPGLGSSDIFVSMRTGPSWSAWTRSLNLGKGWNNTHPHRGFTTVSADGRRAWLSVEGDLWEVELPDF